MPEFWHAEYTSVADVHVYMCAHSLDPTMMESYCGPCLVHEDHVPWWLNTVPSYVEHSSDATCRALLWQLEAS